MYIPTMYNYMYILKYINKVHTEEGNANINRIAACRLERQKQTTLYRISCIFQDQKSRSSATKDRGA